MKGLAFRLAHRAWWQLPAPFRDALRPVLFSPSGVRAVLARTRRARSGGPARSRDTGARSRTRPLPSFPGVPESVSVLIPTLNAGPLFPRVLAAVREQYGIGSMELIVVDSGSTDATRHVALAAGATVVEIRPEDFGHGRTRNVAGEHAAGDVLLMLAQDAILLGRGTVRDLLLELREEAEIAAVSARQVPRSDADLYGAFQVFAHNRVMEQANQGAGGKELGSLKPVQRRAIAGLDDVCAALRRTAWQELRFSDVDFAEDLEFGLRAVERGWSIRVSKRAAVAHSHTRDAAYSLRRSVADRLHIAPLVGDDRLARAAARRPDVVLAASRSLLAEVEGALRAAALVEETRLTEHLRALQSALRRAPDPAPPSGELARVADLLAGVNGEADPGDTGTLLGADLLSLLSWPPLVEFARAHRSARRDDASAFAAKLTASALGRAIGDAIRRADDRALAAELMKGV